MLREDFESFTGLEARATVWESGSIGFSLPMNHVSNPRLEIAQSLGQKKSSLDQGNTAWVRPRQGLVSGSCYSFTPSSGQCCSLLLCINSAQNKGGVLCVARKEPSTSWYQQATWCLFCKLCERCLGRPLASNSLKALIMFSVPCCLLW